MKRMFPFLIVLAVLFLATACGSSTPTATQAPTSTAATEAPAASAMQRNFRLSKLQESVSYVERKTE